MGPSFLRLRLALEYYLLAYQHTAHSTIVTSPKETCQQAMKRRETSLIIVEQSNYQVEIEIGTVVGNSEEMIVMKKL